MKARVFAITLNPGLWNKVARGDYRVDYGTPENLL